jgi:hypothetical protein
MITIHSTAVAASLVDARWLANNLDDPIVRPVEVDVSAAYDRGDVPGAVLWNAYPISVAPITRRSTGPRSGS